jgi:hypothetical protein
MKQRRTQEHNVHDGNCPADNREKVPFFTLDRNEYNDGYKVLKALTHTLMRPLLNPVACSPSTHRKLANTRDICCHNATDTI